MALKDAHGGAVWNTWERGLVTRQSEVMQAWRERLDESVFAHHYYQFQFFKQWGALKAYANDKGVQIVGDIPIFVAYDSVDVWAHPEVFYLDEDRLPTEVAGVPPDYFSPTGQLWGNPLYRLGSDGEGRLHVVGRGACAQTFATVDIVRLDHFRGFAAYWAVPAGEPTAINGQWREGPRLGFFAAIARALGELPIIAEDLGDITADVLQLREDVRPSGDEGPAVRLRRRTPAIPICRTTYSATPSSTPAPTTTTRRWGGMPPGKSRSSTPV